ncbi:hypothetical protein QAD02_010444 [Eretmocerus hayati]|uniref:Uncharacterized protein n=1 Tax=Eretmocerus hayati TaxID=131215 RepID=A0ACC2NUX4_9HYME|nr:hypothetical protein QAD02_010444 [Eretmocerus hayati]
MAKVVYFEELEGKRTRKKLATEMKNSGAWLNLQKCHRKGMVDEENLDTGRGDNRATTSSGSSTAGKKRISFDTTTKIQYQRERAKTRNKHHRQAKDDEDDEGEDGNGGKRGPPGDDDSENQGFGEWLHSANGIDTMKLFVLANSMLIFVTMAWPHLEDLFRQLVYGDDDDYY